MAHIKPSTSLSEVGQQGGFRPEYSSYRSPHAPKYEIAGNMHGFGIRSLKRYGPGFAALSGALGIGLFYFVSDVPRVRQDIMSKIPILGDYFKREIPPEDNPF